MQLTDVEMPDDAVFHEVGYGLAVVPTEAELALKQQARQMIAAVLAEVGYSIETVTELRDQVNSISP